MKVKSSEKPVPCGKCSDCRGRSISAWSFRLMQQEKISNNAEFITLTYDTSFVPISEKGFMSLQKRDLQLFFKRLRKANGDIKIKYFAVGEYGGKSFRPHYHLILFNTNRETIQTSWGLGQVHYGTVTGASVGYTLKYMSKKKRIPVHKNDDRIPEFRLMSKGLGANYLSQSMVHWHKSDLENRMYCNLKDGKKISMPRYYKERLYTDSEKEKIMVAYNEKFMNDELQRYLNSDLGTITRKKEAIKNDLKKQATPDNSKNKI